MKIVLTGGGTGGHVYPAISIAQALKDAAKDVQLLYMGSSHGPEGELARSAGLDFVAIPSGPLTKALSARNLSSLFKLVTGVFRARAVQKRFAPDVVIGTGGYTTASILLAQRSLGGKIMIHEQNARPGRTNIFLAKLADKICVTFDASTAFLPKEKVVLTGLPTRREFKSLPDKIAARRALGLDESMFTIVAVGGSQGAKRPNEIISAAWPLIDDGATQLLHQVGARNINDIKARPRYHVKAYIEMPIALASADLVISRSGASTISEITSVGLPSILFPYPHAYADHQTTNAKCLVEPGAAVLCNDAATTPEALAGIISDLRASTDKLAAMAQASAALGKPDAADRVAAIALSIAGTCACF